MSNPAIIAANLNRIRGKNWALTACASIPAWYAKLDQPARWIAEHA